MSCYAVFAGNVQRRGRIGIGEVVNVRKGRGRTVLFYLLTAGLVLASAHWGSRAVTVIAENTPLVRSHTLVIDAGHGGVDGGATSCAGIVESEYNLAVALRLNDLLRLLGYQTRMIRTTDISVYTSGETIAQKKISDLRERVRIVENTEGALLLSIHQNQFSDARYSGAQVFYASTAGSDALAKRLQAALCATVNPGSSRECKKSQGVYLMEHISCTGVLIECGFLSNPEEEAKLRSAEYQQKLCCVIAATVSEFVSNT